MMHVLYRPTYTERDVTSPQ